MSMFAIRLKELIRENKLHYKDIEAETAIKSYALTSLVNNRCEPDLNTIIKLVEFFGVTADYLVGRSDQKYPIELMELLEEFQKELRDSYNKFNLKFNSLLSKNK